MFTKVISTRKLSSSIRSHHDHLHQEIIIITDRWAAVTIQFSLISERMVVVMIQDHHVNLEGLSSSIIITDHTRGCCGSGSGDDEQDHQDQHVKLTLSISTKKLSPPPTTQWAAVTIHFEATKDPPHIDC